MSDMLTERERRTIADVKEQALQHRAGAKECRARTKHIHGILKRRKAVQEQTEAALEWNRRDAMTSESETSGGSDSESDGDGPPEVLDAVTKHRAERKRHCEEQAGEKRAMRKYRKLTAVASLPHATTDPAAEMLMRLNQLHHRMQDAVVRSRIACPVSRVKSGEFEAPRGYGAPGEFGWAEDYDERIDELPIEMLVQADMTHVNAGFEVVEIATQSARGALRRFLRAQRGTTDETMIDLCNRAHALLRDVETVTVEAHVRRLVAEYANIDAMHSSIEAAHVAIVYCLSKMTEAAYHAIGYQRRAHGIESTRSTDARHGGDNGEKRKLFAAIEAEYTAMQQQVEQTRTRLAHLGNEYGSAVNFDAAVQWAKNRYNKLMRRQPARPDYVVPEEDDDLMLRQPAGPDHVVTEEDEEDEEEEEEEEEDDHPPDSLAKLIQMATRFRARSARMHAMQQLDDDSDESDEVADEPDPPDGAEQSDGPGGYRVFEFLRLYRSYVQSAVTRVAARAWAMAVGAQPVHRNSRKALRGAHAPSHEEPPVSAPADRVHRSLSDRHRDKMDAKRSADAIHVYTDIDDDVPRESTLDQEGKPNNHAWFLEWYADELRKRRPISLQKYNTMKRLFAEYEFPPHRPKHECKTPPRELTLAGPNHNHPPLKKAHILVYPTVHGAGQPRHVVESGRPGRRQPGSSASGSTSVPASATFPPAVPHAGPHVAPPGMHGPVPHVPPGSASHVPTPPPVPHVPPGSASHVPPPPPPPPPPGAGGFVPRPAPLPADLSAHLIHQAGATKKCLQAMERWWSRHPVRELVGYVAGQTRNPEHKLIHGSVARSTSWDGPTLRWVPCMRQCYALMDLVDRAKSDLVAELANRRRYDAGWLATRVARMHKTFGTWFLALPPTEQGVMTVFMGTREIPQIQADMRLAARDTDIHRDLVARGLGIADLDQFMAAFIAGYGWQLNLDPAVQTVVANHGTVTIDGVVEAFGDRDVQVTASLCYLSREQRAAMMDTLIDALEPETVATLPTEETESPEDVSAAVFELKREFAANIAFDFPIVRDAEAVFTRLTREWPRLRSPLFTLETMWDPSRNALWQEFADMVAARVAFVDKSTGAKPDYKGADVALIRRSNAYLYLFEEAYLRADERDPEIVYLETRERKCAPIADDDEGNGLCHWASWRQRQRVIDHLHDQCAAV